jgi:beta-N-acetylhexosaminidase
MPDKDLRKKIGQLFLIGFEGRSQTPVLKELITRYHVGGVILFARNISEPLQAWELLRSFKSRGLLRAVDHEGGRVQRLPAPVTHFPPALNIGNTGSEKLAYEAGFAQARELAAVGFNLNFAPVLDIHTNPVNRVIGDRAFGTDPNTVARLGCATIKGMQAAGIATCGKHFPGHGDTRDDSHEVLPRVRSTVPSLKSRELVPFGAAIHAGVDAMMTAHVVYEGLDPERPATLSSAAVNGLLRKDLRFDRVVMTDDLEMRGIADHYDPDDAAILALKAGVDVMLFCHSPARQVAAIEAVYKAVDGRILKPEVILAAWERVQRLKQITRKSPVAANAGELMAVLNDPEHKRLAASLA